MGRGSPRARRARATWSFGTWTRWTGRAERERDRFSRARRARRVDRAMHTSPENTARALHDHQPLSRLRLHLVTIGDAGDPGPSVPLTSAVMRARHFREPRVTPHAEAPLQLSSANRHRCRKGGGVGFSVSGSRRAGADHHPAASARHRAPVPARRNSTAGRNGIVRPTHRSGHAIGGGIPQRAGPRLEARRSSPESHRP